MASPKVNRRELLTWGAVAGAGATVAGAGSLLVNNATRAQHPPVDDANGAGTGPQAGGGATAQGLAVEPFFGVHQPGISTPAQAHCTFVAFDLLPDSSRASLQRMFRILSDDIQQLMLGTPALADSEPELAKVPAGLTVTVGVGSAIVRLTRPDAVPAWLAPLPPFSKDALEDRFSGGDLIVQVGSNDPLTLSHAVRMLSKDLRSFATMRWTQQGFRRAQGVEQPGTTMRNLFGQVDGTANPVPGTELFDRVVWRGAEPAWLDGGTSLVLRRIAMHLNEWDLVDRPDREQAVGRTLSTGAPLGGSAEHDEPDFSAVDALGFPVISDLSHLRRARSENPHEQIFRRGCNYEQAPTPGADTHAGLLFASFQADPLTQYVPLQQRLDDLDMMNIWITHIGSAVFAVLPGCTPGSYLGSTLFADA